MHTCCQHHLGCPSKTLVPGDLAVDSELVICGLLDTPVWTTLIGGLRSDWESLDNPGWGLQGLDRVWRGQHPVVAGQHRGERCL